MSDERLIGLVTGHGLGPLRSITESPLASPAFEQLLSRATEERLIGLLARAVEDGAFACTAEQRAALLDREIDRAGAALRIERMVLDLAELLDRSHVGYRVLKGVATARCDYPDPGMRLFGDADLLVDGAKYELAVGVFEGAGFQRYVPPLRRGFDARFGKGTAMVNADGLEVDVHRTLMPGPLTFTIVGEDLFVRPQSFALGGRTLLAMAPEARLLNACFGAVLDRDRSRIHVLRDVAQIALGADHDEARRMARRWHISAVLAAGILRTWRELEIDQAHDLHAWAQSYQLTEWDRRILRLYRPGASYADLAVATLRVVPGLRNKAAFAFAHVVPNRKNLRGRSTTRGDIWRRGWRRVTHLGCVRGARRT